MNLIDAMREWNNQTECVCCAEKRIAKLEAALRDARYLLENHASEKHILERIAAALKGDAE